tara:strand:+ start:61 stop:945 length:885 start_codon:yes stop_codon:yes gene_type:complete
MDNKKTHFCEPCSFSTNNKADYVRHCKTNKHFLRCKKNDGLEDNKKTQKNALPFTCECGKKYKFHSGLCKHKKICIIDEKKNEKKDDNNMNNDYKDIIVKLLEENKEFKSVLINQQKQIGELIPKIGNTVTNNINNHVNINIFLREECKDALNMEEFINKIELTPDQLNLAKTKGLTEGISKVFIDNISKLSLYHRPLHCTDIKKEILYVKDNDNWEKDDDKSKIKKAIKDMSMKHFKTLQKWTEENPDFKNIDKKKDDFLKMLTAVSEDTSNLDDKVIKKLCNSFNINNSNDN